MELSRFLLLSLAGFSITYLLRYFEGPFDILLKFRKLCGVRYVPVLNKDGERVSIVEEEPLWHERLARLVTCHWCLTTWVTLVVFIVEVGLRPELLLYWFAGIAVSGILHNFVAGEFHAKLK